MKNIDIPVIHTSVLLIIFSVGILVANYYLSIINNNLLPAHKSIYTWESNFNTDMMEGGRSTISLLDDEQYIDFSFNLAESFHTPYATFYAMFDDSSNPKHFANWSKYKQIKFDVKCSPENILTFDLLSFDDKTTNPKAFITYRRAAVYFACGEQWREVIVDLNSLVTPEWWYEINNVSYFEREYNLEKVIGISLSNSKKSPLNTLSKVMVSDIGLKGRDWRYLYLAVLMIIFVWGLFVFWYFKRYSSTLKEKYEKERALIAYKQMPEELSSKKNINKVLQYLATEYRNPALNLKLASDSLGVSNTKINKILKEEYGLTFAVYLNSLRLAEAARLLMESDGSIAEIAYAVGYTNPSYFSSIFKKHYGCTPGNYKLQTESV